MPSNFKLETGKNNVISRLIIADSLGSYSAKLIEYVNADLPGTEQDLVNIFKEGKNLRKINNTFNGSVLVLDATHWFEYGLQFVGGKAISQISMKFSQNGKGMLKEQIFMVLQVPPDVPITPVCTDWYWTTWDAYTGEVYNESYLYTTCTGGYSYGGGASNSGNESTDITSEFKDYPCAEALVVKMKTLNSDIAKLIKSTFGVNDINNINFFPDASLKGTSIDGQSSPLNRRENSSAGAGTFQLSINPDILNNSTQEYILVTLYHEALHAYFANKLAILGQDEFSKQFQGIEVNGSRLIGVQDLAHSPMGYMKFVGGLKDVITTFNPSFGEAKAWALAEFGILNLDDAKININKQERNSSTGSTGTKCPK